MCRVATRFARRFLQFTMLLPSFSKKMSPIYTQKNIKYT